MNTVIIGGGWGGLAAAVKLSQNGHPVTVLEAAKQIGGRARSVQWNDLLIDNGQHLMIGGYTALLNMLDLIGADRADLFEQLPLDISVYNPELPTLKLGSSYPSLSWPLPLVVHCLQHNGVFVLWQIIWLRTQINRCHQRPDQNVDDWLVSCRQSPRLIKQLWEPLCLATLNTPIAKASAHIFANVIQDMLSSSKAANLLIPKKPLSDIFPRHATNYICNNGGQIKLQTRVTGLQIEHNTIKAIETAAGERIPVQQLILATNPLQARRLLPDLVFNETDHPITTLYLQFNRRIHLPQPMIGLTGGLAQWLFDRQHQRPGLLSVVISGPGEHEKLDGKELAVTVCAELNRLFPDIPLHPASGKVICEKRATFASSVNVQSKRPGNSTLVKGLWLAGDYTASPYPATLESAVQSGQHAASLLLNWAAH